MVSFLVNGVLAIMLLVATVFLVLVNKRLKVLRSGQEELNGLMAAFSATIDETDASTKRLVGAATEISLKLADDLDRAKSVSEDMDVLLASCDRAAKRLEESVQMGRALVRRLDEAPRPRSPESPSAPQPPAASDEGPSTNASTLASRLAALLGDDLIGPAEEDEKSDADDGFQPIKVREADVTKAELSAAAPEPIPFEKQTPPETTPSEPISGEERSAGVVGAFYRQLRTLETTGR